MSNKNKGFTLLELLITTVIFGIFMIAVSAMATFIQRGQEKNLIIQELSDNHSFTLQAITHALRDAEAVAIIGGDRITFTNYGISQEIFLAENAIYFRRITPPAWNLRLTSPVIRVTRLSFESKTPPVEQKMIRVAIEMQATTADGNIISQKTRTNVSIR
jgi:prepilin-type N-terminal cleavage/methylation domain-containing protein